MQLPLALFPLLHFTSRAKWMGKFRNGWFLLAAGWTSAVLITALDLYGLPDSLRNAWRVIAGPEITEIRGK
jgi:manganese transport protein